MRCWRSSPDGCNHGPMLSNRALCAPSVLPQAVIRTHVCPAAPLSRAPHGFAQGRLSRRRKIPTEVTGEPGSSQKGPALEIPLAGRGSARMERGDGLAPSTLTSMARPIRPRPSCDVRPMLVFRSPQR